MRELFIEELASVVGGSNMSPLDTTIWRCEEVFWGYSLDECLEQTLGDLWPPPF